ncbi:MAG TPA: BTAD domain-containing putative transcriptional regulator, partial [Longimicrobiaceae bacterium]|nr:BTAD domain-containing putative transcriptional regulator [Longimicrobiaceae bacterium]
MLLRKQFRLVTLGRLALLTPSGAEDSSLGKQRRKLAVLAVLALTPRPVARDHLIEMFWGDQEESRARHSLSEALSHLRRVLGREAITLRRSEVALSEGVALSVDAREFAQAVAERRYGCGLQLYGGPFLDGIYVEGSVSFEHWVERERARLEGIFREACEQECQALAHVRRWAECADVARRWLESDPLSSEAAAQLLCAVQAPGTREAAARAVEEYERLRVWLERDFGLAPEPGITELAAGIRERLAASDRDLPAAEEEAASAALPDSPPPLAEAAERAPWPPAPTTEDAPSEATAALDAASGPAPMVRRWRRTRIAIASVFIVVAAVLTFWRGAPIPAPVSPTVVAVFPFQVHGGEEFDYLRGGMVDLLSINLDGAGALRSVEPRALLDFVARQNDGALVPEDGRAIAVRFGAGLFVLGNLVEAGEHLQITATLYDQRGRGIGRAAVEGQPSELLDLVDLLTAQLLAAQSRGPADRLTRVAALTTSSLPALKSFLEGEEH